MESSAIEVANIPILKFSTLDFPLQDRFSAWVSDNCCDSRLTSDEPISFDAAASGVALGPFILSSRRWLNRKQKTTYEVLRTERRIKADGHDFYRFTLPLFGKFLWRTMALQPVKSVGDLFVIDAAQVFECTVETGDVISLVAPRDLLPSDTALLHGTTLTGGIGRLLADHVLSLFQNLSNLKRHELPYIVQSTHQLLIAAVSSTPDTLRAAGNQIHDAVRARVQRYIDMHLLEPDLTPDRICSDVGLSRAKLYQLFEGQGGVMRQIQRKRLRQAYRFLSDPNHPRALVAEIASSHGFPNEKYFHRLFKAEFGHTPLETIEKSLDFSPLLKAGALARTSDSAPVGWTLPYGVPSN